MKTKFDQQVLSDHDKGQYGDCTRAVVYTLAQRNLGLPHPIDHSDPTQWNMEFFEELEQKHGLLLDFYPREKDFWPRYVGRSGISPRNIRHLVVWDRKENKLFHDPHPSREGLIPGSEDGWFVLKEIES